MKKTVRFLPVMSLLFVQLYAQNKTELVSRIAEEHLWLNSMMVNKFVTLNLSKNCWEAVFANKSPQGIDHFSRWGGALVEYAKLMDFGDLDALGGLAKGAGEKANRPKMETLSDGMKGRFSFTIQAATMPCDELAYRLLMGYSATIRDFVSNGSGSTLGVNRGWRPRAGVMFITLVMSANAKDVSITISPDGKNFTVTAPSQTEVNEWDTKIEKGLARGGK